MKTRWIRLVLAGLPVLLLLASSCSLPKVPATGQDDQISVFADDTTWSALEPAIRFVFEDTVFTPVPETWFKVDRVPYTDWDLHETEKNRIVIGTLDGTGPVSRFIQAALDSTVRTLVSEGREFYFARYDSKAQGQLLMFLVAPTARDLNDQMRAKAPDLEYYFRNQWLKREIARIQEQSSYNKEDIARSLLRRNGWTMTIEHDYVIARDTSQARFFWMRRANPSDLERWIFVAWWDSASPSSLTDQWAWASRDSITKKWLRTVDNDAYVEIAPYNQSVETVNFLKRYAIQVRGNWRFSDKSGGGPFVNYTFYDEGTRRIYMLDGSIFAPRVAKKKLIMQVATLSSNWT
jgi:hypothetical protein